MSYGGYIERALPLLERLVRVQERRADLAEANANRDATGEGLLLPGEYAAPQPKVDHTDRRYAIPVDVVEFQQPALTGEPNWIWWVKPDSRIGMGRWVESEGTSANVIGMTVGDGQNTKLVIALDHSAESEGYGNPVAFRDSTVRAAVMELQKAFGMTPDGIIGKATMHRIQGIYPRRPA